VAERLRVLFHFEPGAEVRAWVEAQAAQRGLQLHCCAEGDEAGLRALLPETEVWWHVLQPVTPALLAAAPRLRLVQKLGVGVNTIALEAARAAGVAVCNAPGTNARAVAELTLMLMLAALRRAAQLQARLRAGHWAVPGPVQEQLGELGGRTVGLVGFGAVPALLAPWLAAMGARVVHHTRTPRPGPFEHLPLEALLERSDIVSLHLPLTPQTEGLLDERAFARMKPGAVLVNTARGGLVDEAALLRALHSGRLRAAGLDVYATEPLPADHPLLALEQVVATPHTAWMTPETLQRCLAVALDNACAVRDGRGLAHRVV
jgi:phosphoglycerate dehydrogenase-like enzyme